MPQERRQGPVDERAFRAWYTDRAKRLGLNPNPDDPKHFYDYRAAFMEGAEPDQTGHWPSTFKREGHPRLVVDGIDTRTGQPVDDQQQREYVSTDPNFGEPVKTPPPTERGARPPMPSGEPAGRAIRDFAIGAGKGLARTGLDFGKMMLAVQNPNMMNSLVMGEMPTPSVLESTNTAQRLGGFASDVATTALPGGNYARGGRMAANLSNRILRHAVPEFTEKMATQALERGAGPVTEASAKLLAKEAKATPTLSSTVVQRAGKWVPKSRGPSKLQPAADAMAAAAAQKMKPVTVGEAAAVLGGGTIGGSMVGMPVAGALIGGAKLLGRPLPASTIAQLLYNLGPTAQGVLGGVGALGVRDALAALFSSGGEERK